MAMLQTLYDSFPGSSLDSAKWLGSAGSSVSGGTLHLDTDLSGSVQSQTNYDLTSSSAQIELVSVGNSHTNLYINILILIDPTTFDALYLYIQDNTLKARKTALGVSTFLANVAYNPGIHRYFRIREASGTIYFDISVDGITWTNFTSTTKNFTTTNMRVQINTFWFKSAPYASTAQFDNFNFFTYTRTANSAYTSLGVATPTYELATMTAESGASGGSIVIIITTYQQLAQKEYEYRVFDKSGNFLRVWEDPISDFSYSQPINGNASELTVVLPRSPDNRVVKLERLKDYLGADILDENSDPILLQTETANAVGPDTDVDLNYRVDVYVFYGGYDQLLDEFSSPIIDENSEPILVQYGFPNGRRVYSGYIADYELTYGDKTGVTVQVVPNATEMSHYIFKSGSDTTVPYLSIDPSTMARNAMDNYISQGGIITYDTTSIPLSSTSVSYEFNLQTTRETVDKVVDLLPSGWYHYVHPGENKQYVLSKGSVADHVFYYEKHISQLKLRKSITQLINKVYFVGGNTGPVDLFKYYEDATSISTNRPGLERLADSRVTLETSASILSNRKLAEFKNPRYRTSVTISDGVYDIEDINQGDMIGFKNFGTFVDNLLLQVVSLNRQKHSVTLDLDMTIPGEAKRLEELKRAIMSEEVKNIGSAPS